MELLKQKILDCGRALDEHVLLVDSFLNHQVDVKLMQEVGREFARRFADAGITRIVTIESSGIAPAAMAALEMDLPLVILKKSKSSILKEGILQTEVFSFTKNAPYMLTLKPQFVHPGDSGRRGRGHRHRDRQDLPAGPEEAAGGRLPRGDSGPGEAHGRKPDRV